MFSVYMYKIHTSNTFTPLSKYGSTIHVTHLVVIVMVRVWSQSHSPTMVTGVSAAHLAITIIITCVGVITLIHLATAQAEMLFGCYGVQPKTNCHTLFVLIQCDRLLFHTTSKSVRILIKYSKQTAHHKHDSCIKI